MKSPTCPKFRIAAAIALIAVAAASLPALQAIPNSIGAIGAFINPAGMRLEDFANRKAMWQSNAELKGEWELWRDDSIEDSTIQMMRLKNTATVFGIKASEVTLQSRDVQALRFEVLFSTEDEATPGKTRDQLIANINAWAGSSMSVDKPKIEAEHSIVEIGTADDNSLRVILAAPGSTES